MWLFAWRNLLTRPVRTTLAVVGLSIPIFGVLGLMSLSNGIRELVGTTFSKVSGVLVVRENVLTPLTSDLPASMSDTLAELPGVRVVAPEVWKLAPTLEGRGLFSRLTLGGGNSTTTRSIFEVAVVEGQDIPSHLALRNTVFKSNLLPPERGGGRYLQPEDAGMPHALVSTKIAQENPNPDGTPKKVGDTLRIGSTDFTIVGLYETGSIIFDVTIVMDIKTARDLLQVGDDRVSCFLVEPDDPEGDVELALALDEALPEIDARSMSNLTFNVSEIIGDLDVFLLLVVGLSLLVGTIGILNTMLMSTSERTLEFGVLRANGWTRGGLLRLVSTESIYLGVLSGLLGCALAFLGASVANQFLSGGIRVSINPVEMMLGFLLSLLMGVLGGLYPAWKAASLPPMEAIRLGGSQ